MQDHTGATQVPPNSAFVHTEGLPKTYHRLARSVAGHDLTNLLVTELSVRLAEDPNLAVPRHSRSRSRRLRHPTLSCGDKVAQVIRGVRKTSS